MRSKITRRGGSWYFLFPHYLAEKHGFANGMDVIYEETPGYIKIKLPHKGSGDIAELLKAVQSHIKKWTTAELCQFLFGNVSDDSKLRLVDAVKAAQELDSRVVYKDRVIYYE